MYKKRSYWNISLALFGLMILIVTIVYANYLAQKLKKGEEANSKIAMQAIREQLELQEKITSAGNIDIEALNQDITVQAEIIENSEIPFILEDDRGVLEGYNFGEEHNYDLKYLEKRKEEFLKAGKTPIPGSGYASKVYFFNTRLLTYINYFPIVQLLLIGSFIAIGYFFLQGSKRSEQNRIWAGMAKETAHQLGTPISAIIAWIEHLKITDPNAEQEEIIQELQNDVSRLELVADRFSKIGSDPVLNPVNIYDELDSCRAYMERRAPRKVEFEYPKPDDGNIMVHINKHLFDWVVENLIRNSLDAMDGKGKLSAKIYKDDVWAHIELTDTGKGIPSSKFNTVFEPGYSTKQRGWGLGLSLAKRIINNYHNGKISVKSSKLGEGTTFSIKLPLTAGHKNAA